MCRDDILTTAATVQQWKQPVVFQFVTGMKFLEIRVIGANGCY